MPEIFASITSAITIARKLKEASDKTRDADFKLLVANLNIELAEIKMRLSEVMQENTQQKAKIRELESVEGEPCPKCHQRTWELVSSEPDRFLGEVGGIRRTYECSSCGFSESPLVTPQGKNR